MKLYSIEYNDCICYVIIVKGVIVAINELEFELM